MSESRSVLREIAWREVFPWLLLSRTFRLALQPTILALALAGILLTALGWNLARVVFWVPSLGPELVADVPPERIPGEMRLISDAHRFSSWPGSERRLASAGLQRLNNPDVLNDSPIPYVFGRLTTPLLRLYQTDNTWRSFAFYLFGTLWMLAVWGFAGGMITRLAAVDLGREEQPGVRAEYRVTCRRWFDYFTAPLYPVLGTVIIALLSMPVGWILRADVGVLVGGVLWIFVLLGGILSAVLLLWLMIGWPLMWPAISSEETGDSFEAMSRSFAYAFQRPLHYVFYAAVATVLGLVGWTVVELVCQLALHAANWAVSWGAGYERLSQIANAPSTTAEVTALSVGASMIRAVDSLLLALSEAFAYAFFWVSATAIYLLLRLNVDRAELDEVWMPSETPRYPSPPAPAASPPSTSAPLAPAATPSEAPSIAAEPASSGVADTG